MSDAESLESAIVAHFSKYLSDLPINSAADRGAVSLLLEQAKESMVCNNLEKLHELLVEIAKVSLDVGLARGRLQTTKEIFEVLQKWGQKSD